MCLDTLFSDANILKASKDTGLVDHGKYIQRRRYSIYLSSLKISVENSYSAFLHWSEFWRTIKGHRCHFDFEKNRCTQVDIFVGNYLAELIKYFDPRVIIFWRKIRLLPREDAMVLFLEMTSTKLFYFLNPNVLRRKIKKQNSKYHG